MSLEDVRDGFDEKQGLKKLEYFKVFREYRMCEQNLLNHWVTWNLAVQGFLFATYGICIQKLAELEAAGKLASPIGKQFKLLLVVIPLVGVLLSVLILLAVWAAYLVLKELDKIWKRQIKPLQPHLHLPDPSAGGIRKAFVLGFLPPLLIPSLFGLVWIAILIAFALRH
jgi:hypothetical protein